MEIGAFSGRTSFSEVLAGMILNGDTLATIIPVFSGDALDKTKPDAAILVGLGSEVASVLLTMAEALASMQREGGKLVIVHVR